MLNKKTGVKQEQLHLNISRRDNISHKIFYFKCIINHRQSVEENEEGKISGKYKTNRIEIRERGTYSRREVM